ncbi:hypothetical protein F0U60_02625 [Archangium minus]|uniref:Lipoprotein n=1 Tax=Archangium minus TaxID=83450 RepID=A0ABY9WHL1_9BACT|nr:hypothetical protein F0U60_02625 [Archangium minus]
MDVRSWRKNFEELDLIPGSFSSQYGSILQTPVHEYKVAGNTLWLYPFSAEEVPTTPTTYVTTWEARLFFQKGNNPVDHATSRENQQSLSNVELKCPEGLRRVMSKLIHEPTQQAYTLNLSTVDDLPMPVADMKQAVQCTLTGVLTVPIMSASKSPGYPTAELPLNITLLAPPAPQPQPTALPAPVL